MMPVRLEPAAPRSRVKHSTTEPLPSHMWKLCSGNELCPLSTIQSVAPCADPENTVSFQSAMYFTEGCRDLTQEAIGPFGSNCFSRGSIPVFLRKPIATSDFSGVGGGGGSSPPLPSLWIRPWTRFKPIYTPLTLLGGV